MPNYSDITSPLTCLTKKEAPDSGLPGLSQEVGVCGKGGCGKVESGMGEQIRRRAVRK